MNWKTAMLISIIILATAATSFVFGVSLEQPSQNTRSSDEFYSFMQPCNGTEVEPNRPIDTPGGPT